MYHCHFEDVEHVQIGMTGIVFVRPLQDGTSIGGFTKFAYNDGDGSTGYHRHFVIVLNEIWKDFRQSSLGIGPCRFTPHCTEPSACGRLRESRDSTTSTSSADPDTSNLSKFPTRSLRHSHAPSQSDST
jgi:hypothetical protein